MDAYFPILQQLSRANIQFAIIGTFALKHHFPEKMATYTLGDCDLIIQPNLPNINLAISVLRENDWKVSLWEQEVNSNLEWTLLEGKFYLRATQNELQLDLTYECPWIPWVEMESGINRVGYLPIAAIKHVKRLKQIKGSPKDLRVLDLLK